MVFEFFIYLTVLIFSYGIGRFYNRFILKQRVANFNFSPLEHIVINLMLGVFLTVIITANIATSFTSTYFLLFLIILSPIYLLRKKPRLLINNEFLFSKKYLIFIGVVVLFFIYHELLFNRFLERTPFYDFLFLAKISSGLILNGTESFYAASSAFYNTPLNPHLYHYFELWFTGLIAKVFNHSEYQTLLFVVFPILHLITFSLLFIIFKTLFKKFYFSFFGAIGILFGMKLYLNVEGNFFELVETYRGLPYSLFYKLLTIYLFALLAYFFYIKKIYWLSSISICSLIIIYPTTIPGTTFLAVLVFCFKLFKFKKPSYFSLAIFLVVLYLVIFQKVYHFDKMTDLTIHLYSLKQYVVLFIESIIKIFLEHYLVICLLLFLVFKNIRLLLKNTVFVFVTLTTLGSIVYVFINPPGIRDLNQIISNFSPILLLILTVELLRFIKNEKWLNFILMISIMVSCYNIYFNFKHPNIKLLGKENYQSIDFTKKVEALVVENKEANFCSISNLQPADYYYHTSMKFNYLLKIKELKTPLEIKVLFDSKKEIKTYKDLNKYYPPNSYFTKHLNTNKDIYKYLKLNHMKYVLVEHPINRKASDFLNDHCSLVLKDGKTSDAIYTLN